MTEQCMLLTQCDILLMYERNKNASRDVIVDEEVERGVDGVIGDHVLLDANGETMSLTALGEIAVALVECWSSWVEGVDIAGSTWGMPMASSCGFRDPEIGR